MAGGRRPGSYVPGTRHNSGPDRAPASFAAQQQTQLVQPHPAATTLLPPWIPSIWQPPPDKHRTSTPPPPPLHPLPPPPTTPPPPALHHALHAPAPSRVVAHGVSYPLAHGHVGLPVAHHVQAPHRPTAEQTPQSSTAAALGAALDAAVSAAVARALGAAAQPPSPSFVASAASSDEGVDDLLPMSVGGTGGTRAGERARTPPTDAARGSGSATASPKERERERRERSLADAVAALEQRLLERDETVRALTSRLDAVDARSKRMEQSAATETARARAAEARADALSEKLHALQSAVGRVGAAVGRGERDAAAALRKVADVGSECAGGRMELRALMERTEERAAAAETTVGAMEARVQRGVDEARRVAESQSEGVSALRSRVRRVETVAEEVGKQGKEAAAMSSSFQDGVNESIRALDGMMGKLNAGVEKITTRLNALPAVGAGGGDGGAAAAAATAARVAGVEGGVKQLKRLIEHNLRNQHSAESIVKEQVSLITKHVCMAMRQYTARRISENNVLIDQALRARVPDYAANDDQFVLVREEDADGAGDAVVDVHRALGDLSAKQ